MKNIYKKYLLVFLLIIFSGCVPNQNILSETAEKDIAENHRTVEQMKNRSYDNEIRTVSNTVSEVLSNIDKSAKLLENELGEILSVDTGFPVFNRDRNLSALDNEEERNSYSNTFRYHGHEFILWVRVRASGIRPGRTEVNLTFFKTAAGNRDHPILPLPPGYTRAIYDKLWSAIEKEL